jgi:hypothetical protein
MTAHVDVAARAGSQELSVTRLAEMLGASKIPLRRDVVQTVADMWVNYQLLARAAAHNDSLNQQELIDAAMWPGRDEYAHQEVLRRRLQDVGCRLTPRRTLGTSPPQAARGAAILFYAPPDTSPPHAPRGCSRS